MQSRAPPMGSPNQGIGDHHEDEEEQGGHCFQAIDSGRSSFWMMRVLRTVACQGTHMRSRGDPLLQSVGGAAATVREVLRQPYHHYYYNNNFSTSSPQLHFRPALSPDHARFNPMNPRMKDLYTNPLSRMDDSNAELARAGAGCCASSRASVDGLSSDTQSVSFGEFSFENRHDDDTSSSSDVSSPLGWPLGASPKSNPEDSSLTMKSYGGSLWEERRRMRDMDLPEAELMKERFAKLLLGEDMSGGGKGVCTALAISNAITNLSACVFGEIWRLEPLPSKYRSLWRREMEWLVSVSDYMIEMLPSQQALPDGSTLEVMITRPRSDLQINIPALRKLDDMLLECLDSFHETDFWYDDQSSVEDDHTGQKVMIPQQEKWWLPLPKVPINGISEESRKGLQHQKECVNQILKATMAINNQILVDMDVPDAYWEALPKNGRASLGEDIYKKMVSDHFSAEALLCSLDISTEHKALEIANRLEASIHLWRERGSKQAQNPGKDAHLNNKGSWGKLRSLVTDIERRELLARRSENILFCLKQRFPGLPQTLLDITKIQFNKDVGQSILESYSRVLESLAFNIMARIDDVLYVDDMAKSPVLPLSGKASLGFTSSLHVSPIPTPAAQSLAPTPLPSPGRSLC